MARLCLFAVLMLLTAGCTVPPLNTDGRIRCGSGAGTAECPASFECRFNRCCPVGSDVSTCPTEVEPDETGNLYACPTGSGCPNTYECRFGRCCPATSSATTCPAMVEPDPTGDRYRCPMGTACPNSYECRFGRCCPAGSAATCPVTVDPDPTGDRYRCPTGTACPNGYDCRFGRCCPAGSSATSCPTAIDPDPTGTLYRCSAMTACPVGHECRWGKCCPEGSGMTCPQGLDADMVGNNRLCLSGQRCPDGYSCHSGRCCRAGDVRCENSPVGTPCTAGNVCGHAPVEFIGQCLSHIDAASAPPAEFSDGYCVTGCTGSASSNTCEGRNGFCFADAGTAGVCFPLCSLVGGGPSPCRVGANGQTTYVCARIPGLIPGPTFPTDSTGLCIPDCTIVPSMCDTDESCNSMRHVCGTRCGTGFPTCPGATFCRTPDNVCDF